MSTQFNLLRDGIEDVAEGIKLRILATRSTTTVYVRQDGSVLTERTHDSRRSRDIPDSALVGVYTRVAGCEDLEDDLVIRLGEIRRGNV